MKRFILFALTLVLAGRVAVAQTWTADVAHSRVEFTVTHMMFSEVNGRFTDFQVSLTQGKEDFSGSTVNATIATKSVNTDNEGRDKHLRGDDFFNAEKFPAITFASTAFEKTGEKSYRITGKLTMRDVTKDVVLDATLLGTITDQRGNTRVAFKATTTVNRLDYDVKWSRSLDGGGLVVGNDVRVTLVFQLIKQK